MVCGGVSKASGVSQSVQEDACQCCPFGRVCATAYLHTQRDRLTLSAMRQGTETHVNTQTPDPALHFPAHVNSAQWSG